MEFLVPSAEQIKLILELLKTLFTLAGAVGIIAIGGGFLAREKYNLLSQFWHHASRILDEAILFTSIVKRHPEETYYERFHKAREEHQNQAADYLNRLEIILAPELVEKTREVFKILQKIDSLDAFKERYEKEDSKASDRFYDYNEKVKQCRDDLKSAIRKELRKPQYWFLK